MHLKGVFHSDITERPSSVGGLNALYKSRATWTFLLFQLIFIKFKPSCLFLTQVTALNTNFRILTKVCSLHYRHCRQRLSHAMSAVQTTHSSSFSLRRKEGPCD